MRILLSVAVLALCGQAVAAEQKGLPEHYIQEQEHFAGRWIGKGHVGRVPQTVHFDARWAPGKHCLVIHGTTKKKNEEPARWSILSGCNVDTGEMVDCYFGADGVSCVTRWKSVSESKQVGTETGVDEGKPYSVQCEAVKHGADAWTYTSTTPDGKPIRIEYRRVDVGPNYKHIKFLKPLLGELQIVTTENGKIVSEGVESAKWILNRNFMIHDAWGQFEGEPVRYAFITGWNPKTQEVFQWGAGGNPLLYGFQHRIGTYDLKTQVWTARAEGVIFNDVQHSDLVKLGFANPDKVTLDFTKGRRNGKPVPDRHDVFTRRIGVTAPEFDENPGPGHEHLKPIKWLIGDWKIGGSWADGKLHMGEEHNEWAFNRNFIKGSGWYKDRDGKRINYMFLITWDPQAKNILMAGIGSDGGHSIRIGQYDSQTKTITSRQQGVLGTGEESSFDHSNRLVNKNTFEWIGTNFKSGDRSLPDLKLTFTRK